MDPNKTVIQMVHQNNTYNKRPLLINAAQMPEENLETPEIAQSLKKKFGSGQS